MTVFLLAAGGALAGLGTRLSALFFVASAVSGARQPTAILAALCTWTAVTAAGWVLLDRGSPRSVAVPALGAAAVLAAAGAPNGAVVLGLWVLGTVAVVLRRGELTSGRRWAIGLAAGDVVFAVAVATTAGRGFEGWPFTLKLPGAIAMLAAAVLRAPLAGGPTDRPSGWYPACLVVRAQTILLLALAARAADRPTAQAILVLGVLAFAAAPWAAARRATVDAVQELGLVGLAVGAASLGWVGSGWVWGVLAAGTLIHHLRFILGNHPSGRVADAIGRGAGIGLPFLPVCVALLEGSLRASNRLPVVVLFGVLAGLAGRTRLRDVRADGFGPRMDAVRAWGPVVAVALAAVAAPVLWTPSPPAGRPTVWPPLWAAGVVVVAAVVGSRFHLLGPDPGHDGADDEPSPVARIFGERIASIDALATDVVLWATVTAVAAAAVVLWLVGLGRGFL